MRLGIALLTLGLAGCTSLVDASAGRDDGASSGAVPSSGSSDTTSGGPSPSESGGVTSLSAGEDSGSTAPGDATAATSSSSDDSSGATTSLDSSSSGVAESSSTGDDEPTPLSCDSPPGDPLTFLIDGAPVADIEQLDLQATCEVWSIEDDGDAWTISVSCEEGPVSVTLSLPEPPGLGPGDLVEFSLFVDSPLWGNGFVKIVRDGQLQVAAMTSQALPIGGGSFPPSDFFAPLSLSLVADLCEPEPLGDDGGDPPCTQDRRLGLAFTFEDASTTVLDRTGGDLGPLALYVGRTVSHVNVFCPDTPDGWREFVAVRP